MMESYTWHPIDAVGAEDVARQIPAIEKLIESHPSATLDHDPRWLEAKASAHGATVRIFVCHDSNGALLGYAPFYVHRSAFEFNYGGYSLWHYAVRRYSLTSTPLLQPRIEAPDMALTTLVQRVRQELEPRDVLFLLGLNMGAAVSQQIESGHGIPGFILMAHGPAFLRRRAKVGSTLDDYLSALGSKTRQDIRRHERRLLKEADDDVHMSVHTEPESVTSFLEAVEQVSRQTYQWKQLGMGIANSGSTPEVLRASAQNGWFRGYVLHAQGHPIAFMVGHLYRDTYLSESIGYDPDWHKLSAGNVLHLFVMRDLSSLGDGVTWFDFMYGDNSNKERLSTDAHLERNYYLIPDTLRWRGLTAALKGFDKTTSILTAQLDRYGVKDKIRRALRKRAIRSGE